MFSILIVDDDASIRSTLGILLKERGYRTYEASSGEEALRRMEEGVYDLMIVDLRIGHLSGIDLLGAIKERSPDTEVLMLTAYGSVETAVEAMKLGAFDYLTKPFERDEILLTVEKALERRALRGEVRSLREQLKGRYAFEGIVAKSGKMRRVLELAATVARTDATVVIEGESGTGKELIARAIHANSGRAGRPFVAINCGALPEALFESELFGHTKGAFTGAVAAKKGLFEEADRGTLFFDEVGEMSPALQVKLLRALQDGEIRRVGSNAPVRVDVRVIAATNRSLIDLMEKGQFREDLYYRLSVIPMTIPPLRDRREDIIPLAERFLRECCRNMGKNVASFSPEAVNILLDYDWPGNVRELKNVIERAVVLSTSEAIAPENLIVIPPKRSTCPKNEISKGERNEGRVTLRELEREYIESVLNECSGNRKMSADILGIGRSTLWRKLKEYGIT
ncbi:MAG: sigma-54-dependent transcriptional regulator [bacterium]